MCFAEVKTDKTREFDTDGGIYDLHKLRFQCPVSEYFSLIFSQQKLPGEDGLVEVQDGEHRGGQW